MFWLPGEDLIRFPTDAVLAQDAAFREHCAKFAKSNPDFQDRSRRLATINKARIRWTIQSMAECRPQNMNGAKFQECRDYYL
eukprot:2884271-Amphidinium_carterae.1